MIQNTICNDLGRLGSQRGVVLKEEKREKRMMIVVLIEPLNNRI